MPARKTRKTARGHQQSTAGKILPPLDVKTKESLHEFIKRILAGPITIILIYANWCGHCHHFMPHFDAAARSKQRSIQAVKLNETMMDAANEILKEKIGPSVTPITVKGYPTLKMISPTAEEITELETVNDTKVMTDVVNNAGNLARNAGIANTLLSGKISANTGLHTSHINRRKKALNNALQGLPSQNRKELLTTVESNDMMVTSHLPPLSDTPASEEIEITDKKMVLNVPPQMAPLPSRPVTNGMKETVIDETKLLGSMKAMLAIPPKRVDPSTIPAVTAGGAYKRSRSHGGSLYEAMAHSATALAPAAVLLAAADHLLSRQTRNKRRNKRRNTRRTRR